MVSAPLLHAALTVSARRSDGLCSAAARRSDGLCTPLWCAQDPSGKYCRQWLPELTKLPNKYLHVPWLAPADVLRHAGVELGASYPERILPDLPAARAETVDALLEARREALDLNDPGGYDPGIKSVRPPRQLHYSGPGSSRAFTPLFRHIPTAASSCNTRIQPEAPPTAAARIQAEAPPTAATRIQPEARPDCCHKDPTGGSSHLLLLPRIQPEVPPPPDASQPLPTAVG